MATINGTSGSDVLNGTGNNDFINGFGASDTISGLRGNDRGLGGGGADFIQGGFGLDTLGGGSGNDTLNGNQGRDQLFGNGNNDWLIGGGGDDTLNGGAGNDILRGGFGNDSLIGGGGRDRFLIGSSQGIDTIADFEDGTDQLRLLQGEKLDGIRFSELELRASGTSTRIFLDKPGNQRDGDLLAIVKNIAPNKITEADIFVPNEPPTAQDDAVSGTEDTVINGNVLADNGSGADSDPDGNPLEIVEVNGSGSAVGNPTEIASGAIVTLNTNGTLTYNPNGAFDTLTSAETTTDSFTYTVSDGKGGLDTATVTVNLTGVNDAPVVTTNTGATVDEGGEVVISRTQLDETDPDDDSTGVRFTITTPTSNGRVELTTAPGDSIASFTQADINNNLVRYVHDGSETTSDSFDFSLADGGEDGATADLRTFTFTINPVNDPPVAVDDELATDEDTTLNGNLFAANPTTADSDPDDATFSVTAVNGNSDNVDSTFDLDSGAQLTVNSNGTFSYNPNGQFDSLADGASTTDTFSYQIGDGNGGFGSATATVTISGLNDAPVAVDDEFITDEDTALTAGNVLSANPSTADSDPDTGDSPTVTEVNGNAVNVGNLINLGSGAQLTLNSNGTFYYDPNGAFESINSSTTDTFTYQIGDGNGGFDTATATVIIAPVNDAPLAVDDSVVTDENTSIGIDVLGNDSDVDGDSLSIDSFTNPSNGSLLDNGRGTLDYTPNTNFTGSDSFAYTITDGRGGSDTATVNIVVGFPTITSNDGGDTATIEVAEGNTAVTNIETSDGNDTEGGGLAYSFTTNGMGGADNNLFNLDTNTGALSFAAAPDFEDPGSADSDNEYLIQVTVTNTAGLTDTQDITVNVTDVATPTVTIDSPASMSSVVNFVLVGFTGSSEDNNPLIYDFSYSTDSGTTFLPATDFGGGTTFGNPTVVPQLPGAETWEWDSSADIRTDELGTIFQVGVTDLVTSESSTSQIVWDVPNQATSSINNPAEDSVISGNTAITFTTVQPSPNGLDLVFEYSTDGGATYSPATDGGGGSVTGNPVLGDPPGSDTWEWDTATDIPTSENDVIFRQTITDAVFGGGTFTTQRIFDVDNAAT